ncbi:MAG: isoamylase early set domain-containing protein [Spirochaetales bacterium]|nr:isoamylase early set domain-containing protein [Spirochaetales bacterium]
MQTKETGTCQGADELVRAWEARGLLGAEELALLNAHLAQCPRCLSAYGQLLPLMRRDAGRPAGLGAAAGPLFEGFEDRVMGRLGGRFAGRAGRSGLLGSWRTPAGRRCGVARAALALAAGAALLVAGGLLTWFWGFRSSGEEVLVQFELVAPEARQVNLVGDFNGWDSQRLAMKDTTGEGRWQIAIRLKKGQVYTYNFLMDGQRWIADPASLRQVEDGFGGTSSVLEL